MTEGFQSTNEHKICKSDAGKGPTNGSILPNKENLEKFFNFFGHPYQWEDNQSCEKIP